MFLAHLSLEHFRNYTRLEADLQPRVHVLRGENAQGKTNLLEAIYYLATTRSPLATLDRELVGWSAEAEPIPFARVEGRYARRGAEHTISITLVSEPAEAATGEPGAFRRGIRADGAPRRAIDVVGLFNVALFLPEDINLVAGPPAGRRRYLDVTLCQVDPVYCRTLSRYNRVITQRNALLRQIREGKARVTEQDCWDDELVRLGSYVLERRRAAVADLGAQVAEIQPRLSGAREDLVLRYEGTVAQYGGGNGVPAAVAPAPGAQEAAQAEVAERFRKALAAVRREEAARGMTVVGPHRDDLRFLINGHDATVYGSRGQQRSVALALKLAEVAFMREATGEAPVLLLDDVMSELDRQRSRQVLEMVRGAEQVFITTTSLEVFDPAFLADAMLWDVVAGSLRPASAPGG